MGELDCLRKCAASARVCTAAFRHSQLTIRVVEWPTRVGGDEEGPTPLSELVLPKHFDVQEISLRLIHSSGGRLERGDVQIVDITPAFDCNGSTGGYTKEQLDPVSAFGAPDRKKEVIYRLDGDISGEFTLYDLSLNPKDPTAWVMTLRRTRRG